MHRINFGCHGIPERCFYYKGRRMPFCSRCLGCSIGHVVSFFVFSFGTLPSLWIATVMMMIMLIDWSLQYFLQIMSNNKRRLFTGLLGGFGMGVFIWKTLQFAYLFYIKI
jgi:uncharacterized membrane protein